MILFINLRTFWLRGPAESQRVRIFTPGKKKTWNGSGKKAGVQNGEEGFDLRKTQLMHHEYFVFKALNLCPPYYIWLSICLTTVNEQCRCRWLYSQ
jgi:hypothetical protein